MTRCFKSVCLILLWSTAPTVAALKPLRDDQKTLLRLRGGDLGPIQGKSLAKTFSSLAACNAVAGALIPRTFMQWFGIYVAKDSLSLKYLHGIGASASTVAISLSLALAGSCSVERAIAFGLVARLVSMTVMIVSNEEKKVGMKFSMFGPMWLALVATIYCLLQEVENAVPMAEVLSLVLGGHGLFLYSYPGVALRKTPIAVGPDPLVKEILSIDGGYMIASALVTFLLAQRIDPIKVAGFTAISFIPVMHKVFAVVDEESLWEVGTGMCAYCCTVLVACIIVGTLH